MSFKELIAHSERNSGRLKAVTKPLFEHFGLDVFAHFCVDKHGYFTNLSNSPERAHYYFDNKLYAHADYMHQRSPKTGHAILMYEDPRYSKVLDTIPEEINWHKPLLITSLEADGTIAGFVMAASRPGTVTSNTYINNLPLLKKFCQYFRQATQDLQRPLVELGVNIINTVRRDHLLQPGPSSIDTKLSFLSAMGIDKRLLSVCHKLSPREKEVMLLLTEGKTAAGIASAMHLSRRTVEHYMETLKNKLDVTKKPELIQVALMMKDICMLG